jgi:hypothetical protein
MIFLKQNTSNDVILTLQEKSLLWQNSGITPNYLFVFSSDTTNKTLNFCPTNISSSSSSTRYDEFTIIESGTTYQNLTGNCVVNLNPAYFWTYTIFEQISPYNLLINNTIGPVETGKVMISGYTSEQQAFTYYNNTNNQYDTYVR